MKVNKKLIYIMACIFILVLGVSLIVSNDNEEVSMTSTDESYNYSYYVENPSFISKIAFICDDCCYYIVDMILGGIESVFSKIIG